jgi:glycosyltransferase involved in cell wall biosynthesis
MKRISLISHYYNSFQRAQALIAHLESFDRAILDEIELIIVDDHSEISEKLHSDIISLKQVRVVEDIAWNQGGARNLGALLAQGTWLLYFDIDQQISEFGLKSMVDQCHRLDRETMYMFYVDQFVDSNTNTPMNVHPNTFLVEAAMFRTTGMYDEDFSGNYGYEDLYLTYYYWDQYGGKRAMLGDRHFFQDQNFRTTNLARDLAVNKAKIQQKILIGTPRPHSFVRFHWHTV